MATPPVAIGVATTFDDAGLKEATKKLGAFQKQGQTFSEKFRNVERSFTRTGLVITGVVTALGFAVKKSVDAAMESQLVARQTDAIIASTGQAANVTTAQVTALADALSRKTAIDDEQIQSSLNLLLTFKQVSNAAGEGNDIFNQTAATILDLGNVFGSTDSAAVQLGKALSDPIRGVTALRRVGINFTESQREQIKTLVETGNLLDAQKIILAEVGSQVGGTAEATATGFGRMRVAVDNLNERFGAIFLPLFERFANFISNSVIPRLDNAISSFNNLDSQTKQNILAVGLFVVALGPLLLGIGLAMKAIRLLGMAFLFLQGKMAAIPLVIALLIGALALQVEAMNKGVQAGDNFAIKTLVAFSNILKGFSAFGNGVARTIESIYNGFVAFHNGVIQTGQAFRRFLGIDVPEGAQELQKLAKISLPNVTISLDPVINAARSAFKGFGDLAIGAKDLAAQAKGLANGLPTTTEAIDKAGGAAKKAAEKVLKLDANLRTSLRNAVELGRSAGQSLQDLGGRLLADFSEKILRLGRFTEETAKEFDDLVTVIRGKFDDALAEGQRRLDAATDAFNNFRDEIARGIASEANFSNAAQKQSDAIQAVEDALKAQTAAQKKVNDAIEAGDEDALAKANEELAEANRLLAQARTNQRSFLDFLRVGVTQAQAFASQVEALTNAGASLQVVQQIVSLGATVGGRVAAELLAGGSAAIEEANRLLNIVDAVSQAAGIVAAKRFFQGGIDAANAFIDALKQQMAQLNPVIDEILRRLREVFDMQNRVGVTPPAPAAPQLPPPPPGIGVGDVARIPQISSDLQITSGQFTPVRSGSGITLGFLRNFAEGGVVKSPTAGVIGDAGPEAIIPLRRMGGMGNTYNITVNAGIGTNGADVGRVVVESIKKYEKIAGQQFASA